MNCVSLLNRLSSVSLEELSMSLSSTVGGGYADAGRCNRSMPSIVSAMNFAVMTPRSRSASM